MISPVKAVIGQMGFDRGFILLLDEKGRPTERMRRTKDPADFEFDSAEADFSGSVVRRVAQTGESQAVIDVANDASLRQSHSVVTLGLRSVMCAPKRFIVPLTFVDTNACGACEATCAA